MKSKYLFPLIVTFIIAFCSAGCSAVESSLLKSHSTVTPAVTNAVEVVATDASGALVTNVTLHVTPAVTNVVYEPTPIAQAGAAAIGALPFPGAGTAAIVGGWLLTALAAWRNKKLSVALVKGIDAGRQILQTTPEGQRLDAKFKDALIENQEIAGVLNAASSLVNNYTGDTVKPATP